MKIIKLHELVGTEREVKCPKGGFLSRRFLLEKDNMGFSVTNTIIPPNGEQHWHYKNHLEACYCIKGHGCITNKNTGEKHRILPGTMYVLDNNDPHSFIAFSTVELLCVFNPPLTGLEVHNKDNSYDI
jgi:L-ectoine synthase